MRIGEHDEAPRGLRVFRAGNYEHLVTGEILQDTFMDDMYMGASLKSEQRWETCRKSELPVRAVKWSNFCGAKGKRNIISFRESMNRTPGRRNS
jgi:hypothetical protein